MSHFAKIENNLVTEVIVAEQEFIDTLSGEWVQTSYNTRGGQHTQGGTPLRGNFAGLGYTYDRTNDVFYGPRPYASWALNTTTWRWEAPVAKPDDNGTRYRWDEDTTQWVEVT